MGKAYSLNAERSRGRFLLGDREDAMLTVYGVGYPDRNPNRFGLRRQVMVGR